MKPMGFSAEPEKLGRFRGHFAERSDGRNGASAGQHGAFLTAGETAHWRFGDSLRDRQPGPLTTSPGADEWSPVLAAYTMKKPTFPLSPAGQAILFRQNLGRPQFFSHKQLPSSPHKKHPNLYLATDEKQSPLNHPCALHSSCNLGKHLRWPPKALPSSTNCLA